MIAVCSNIYKPEKKYNIIPFLQNVQQHSNISVQSLHTDNLMLSLQDRVTYTATGEADTLEYFTLGADSGVICVRQILLSSSKTEFRVSKPPSSL